MTGKRKLHVFVVCLLVAAGGGVAYAALSGQTSNSGNTFSAASSFGGTLRMASGTYNGNGTAGRQITGLGFQPDVVIVKSTAATEAFMRTNTMPAGLSKRLVGGNAAETNQITALDADGFTLGSGTRANNNGDTYYWQAFKAGDGTLKVGSYTGNGTSQSISGLGFSPEYVIVADDDNERAVQHFAGSSNSYRFDADAGLNTRVTSLNADGFSVGAANEANRAGRTFHYVAFSEANGSVDVGTYTGTGATRSVSGVGFQPEYVIVRAAGNVTGQHRSASVPGSTSLYFANVASITTGITALQSDGFQTGNHSSVNTSGTTYQYVAFDNTGGGCALPSSQTITAVNDAWVDQANPGANNGTATTLRVRSQTGSLNQRSYVDFDLPTLPSGCVVTGADLFVNFSTVASGRTLTVHRAASAWTESGVTWSNQPATVGTPVTMTMSGATGWLSWNATALVNDQYSSGNFGFRIADQTESAATAQTQIFGSRESGATPPALVLTIGS